LKKFRIDKNKEFSSLIDLINPILVRSIQKYCVIIKRIFKILAIYEKGHTGINGFPHLKLIAKCVVDDGSYEAQMYCLDQIVINLFRLDKQKLEVRKKIYNVFIIAHC
jgi:hypothetical protein